MYVTIIMPLEICLFFIEPIEMINDRQNFWVFFPSCSFISFMFLMHLLSELLLWIMRSGLSSKQSESKYIDIHYSYISIYWSSLLWDALQLLALKLVECD